MQRWIVAVVAAVVLLMGAGAFGFWKYKQNGIYPIYFAIPINPEVPESNRKDIAKQLEGKLHEDELLRKISGELALDKEWDLPSSDAAVDQLRKRITVTETEGNLGKRIAPSINVAIKGKWKEKALSGKIAGRLMEDVWKILGIEPPKK